MAYNRRILEGRVGDAVLPWWQAVWSWANSLPVVIGPGMQVTQVPGYGTTIKVRTAAPVRVFFEVAVSGQSGTIRPGMLSGLVPYIATAAGPYVNLYGVAHLGAEVGTPAIDLRAAKPGTDGRSAIVIVARVNERGDIVDPAVDPSALVIEHRSDFGPAAKREAATALKPFHELAILYWRDGSIDRTAQIVQHNLDLAVAGGEVENEAARYFFYAAG